MSSASVCVAPFFSNPCLQGWVFFSCTWEHESRVFEPVLRCYVHAPRLLPFGPSAEAHRKKRTTSADELAAVRNILIESRTTLQSTNMLRQYLAEVDLLPGESDDERIRCFVCVGVLGDGMHCTVGRFAGEHRQNLAQRKCGLRLGPLCCDQQSVWAAVDRNDATTTQACGTESPQGPGGLSANEGKACNQQGLVGGERKSEPSGNHSIILFCTGLGKEIVLCVQHVTKYRGAPVFPMLLSFVFCEMRKQHETGSTRDRGGSGRVLKLTVELMPYLIQCMRRRFTLSAHLMHS